MTTKIHPSITIERVVASVEERTFGRGSPGFCLACGADADGCEPDASGYTCEICGEKAVEGAENVLMAIA